MPLQSPDEWSLWAKIVGIFASVFAGLVGIAKVFSAWTDSLATKEQVHRHRESNDLQVAKLHTAILDLYQKNEERRTQVEQVRKEMGEGFISVEHSLRQIYSELLRDK